MQPNPAPVAQRAMLLQATLTSDGRISFAGPWLHDRQRCDDFLLSVWNGIRQFHASLDKAPGIEVPDETQTKLLLGG